MNRPLELIEMPDQATFAERYIAQRQPVVVDGLNYAADQWTPDAVSDRLGDLTTLVYGALFDLEDVQTLEDYIDDWFDLDGDDALDEDDVPYVRWYNKLRDVEFAWGDQAFDRLAPTWTAPRCLPESGFLVPVDGKGAGVDPVHDPFPYRGIQIAARGARTRLHRDPFATDAVVCQYYGTKHAVLYRPDRAEELKAAADGSSFGGFIDIREGSGPGLTVEPDYQGTIKPGQMIYIPRGWLHDVYVVDDSLSLTWNFVHQQGSKEFMDYLAGDPESDSEYEILQYFHQLAGLPDLTASQIVELHR